MGAFSFLAYSPVPDPYLALAPTTKLNSVVLQSANHIKLHKL